MNPRDPSSCPSSSVRHVPPAQRRLRPAGLAVAIGSVLGLALPGSVIAGDDGSVEQQVLAPVTFVPLLSGMLD